MGELGREGRQAWELRGKEEKTGRLGRWGGGQRRKRQAG